MGFLAAAGFAVVVVVVAAAAGFAVVAAAAAAAAAVVVVDFCLHLLPLLLVMALLHFCLAVLDELTWEDQVFVVLAFEVVVHALMPHCFSGALVDLMAWVAKAFEFELA